MPKDNEVDEKVRPVAWIVTNGGESCELWLEYEQSEVDALPAVCIAEPLYSAATVAELRAEVERLQVQLACCGVEIELDPPAVDVAKAWQEGYRQGVLDERTSEDNIGIAGFGAKVEPARNNPYALAHQPGVSK